MLPYSKGRRGQAGSAGFALPLATGASLVLVLGGLSLQTAALQGQAGLVASRRSRQVEDRLASAAGQLLARVVLDHPCLLPLPRADWSGAGLACTAPAEQEALQHLQLEDGQSPGATAELRSWEPATAGTQLMVEFSLALREDSAAAPPTVGRFRAYLEPPTALSEWRVQKLQELGLVGGRP
ncbi:MAG: hypothetical protein ACOVNL_12555 [Prochlorococcaceae cyanobacterium]